MIRVTRIVSWLLFVLAATSPTSAQFEERVRVLLIGDTLSPPPFDTAFVKSYRNELVASVVNTYEGADVDIQDTTGNRLYWNTNNAERYGLGINYRWLSAEVTFSVPSLSSSDPRYGETRARSFGLGFTGRRFQGRASWTEHQGFYLENAQEILPGQGPEAAPTIRSDLRDRHLLATMDHTFNRKWRYSPNATLFQMERQKRSAGSWIANLTVWNTRVQADSMLVPFAVRDSFPTEAGFSRMDRWIVGTSFGYTHTFSFWHKGFFNLELVPGGSIHRIALGGAGWTSRGTWPGFSLRMRAAMGYNGDRWYGALIVGYQAHYGMASEALTLGLLRSWGRLALGWRFKGPRIPWLRPIGL